MNRKFIAAFIIAFVVCGLAARQINYLRVEPRSGEGIYLLFERFNIPYNDELVRKFKKLNEGKFSRNWGLIRNEKYALPVGIRVYNGKSIRTTLGIDNYEEAKNIEIFNEKLFRKGVKPADYRDDMELWVPLFELSDEFENGQEIKKKTYSIFGEKHQEVGLLSNRLKNVVFYLVAGHGGPDPGAIGKVGDIELHEDEYAYDVTLRLARKLIQNGALVYLIVRDPDDGIRDDKYLSNSYDEFYFGGDTIAAHQLERLRKRTDIINRLYGKNKRFAKKQVVVSIHVDSRNYGKNIDIFFCHAPGSKRGRNIAGVLENTIRQNYAEAQPGRGYKGKVTSRNFYILKQTIPPCVLIELGNIRNQFDRQRIILKNNRQAIANWLSEGLIKATIY